MSEAEMHAFISETVDSYEKHVNRGFITYRKSVTEAGQFAALEWTGHGSIVTDLMGREYIDCLGGYGIFSAGISNPRVVKAVTDQMSRMALNSQELLEPWRACIPAAIPFFLPWADFTESPWVRCH
jgi:putrescine aminotransferase